MKPIAPRSAPGSCCSPTRRTTSRSPKSPIAPGLVRYAAREALRPHTAEWLRRAGLPLTPAIADVRERPVAAAGHMPLFRIADDPRTPYAEFADAKTLVRFNARFIAREAGALRPGDLLYYQQPSQHTPDHLMVYVGRSPFDPSATDFVVYHTGPADDGEPGRDAEGAARRSRQTSGGAMAAAGAEPALRGHLPADALMKIRVVAFLARGVRDSQAASPARRRRRSPTTRAIDTGRLLALEQPHRHQPRDAGDLPHLPTPRSPRLPRLPRQRSGDVPRRASRIRTSSEARSRSSIRSRPRSSGSRTGRRTGDTGFDPSSARSSRTTIDTRAGNSSIARPLVLRRTISVNSFAQVPLLNRSQLVTSWRELLPPMRDADVRRIPIDVKQPGMYVVEAVLPPHRAYTIVIVSDIGLVTKAAPGQVLAYTADRTSGKPLTGCDIRVLTQQKSMAAGTTGADGVFNARFTDPRQRRRDHGGEVRRADDGHRSRQLVPARSDARAGRLRVHRQADLPARPHRPREGVPALASARCAAAVRRQRTSSSASRTSPTR